MISHQEEQMEEENRNANRTYGRSNNKETYNTENQEQNESLYYD